MLQALTREPSEKVPLKTSDPLHASDTESEHCQDPDVTADLSNFLAERLHGNAVEENQTLKAFMNSASLKTEESQVRATTGSLETEVLPSQHTAVDRLANSSSGSFSDSGFAYVCIEDNLDAHTCAHSKSASSGEDSGILAGSSAGTMATKQLPVTGRDRGAVGAVEDVETSEAFSQLRLSREEYFSDGEGCRPQGRCSSTTGLRRHRSGSV